MNNKCTAHPDNISVNTIHKNGIVIHMCTDCVKESIRVFLLEGFIADDVDTEALVAKELSYFNHTEIAGMFLKLHKRMIDIGVPAAEWRAKGEPDPHYPHYDGERSKLCMGNYTDDELANAAFMNYDQVPPIEDLLSGKRKMPIAYMTAVKDRIRWLSRSLEKEIKINRDYQASIDLMAFKNKLIAIETIIEYYGAFDKTRPITYGQVATNANSLKEIYLARIRKLETEIELAAGEPHH